MDNGETEFLERGSGAPRLALRRSAGRGPTIVWCGGFRADMTGTKAQALHDWAVREGRAFLRFDYSGHGQSGGDFAAGTISDWTADARDMLDAYGGERPLIVGSSMGGWIALLTALARPVSALVLLAPAPDFTERLMWQGFSEQYRRKIEDDGRLLLPSPYSPGDPTIITRALIEDGRTHLILDRPIAIDTPVRILHGQADPDVPWRQSLELAKRLTSADVETHFVKDGDHRLSRPQDINLLVNTVARLANSL
jgi:pimeloyl-ACP methyl ester carboxylesterase